MAERAMAGSAFGPFERTVAFRYLRARRGERSVSLIAGFSLGGIALGVATLIIVLSVMGGFRQELLGRILGLNGHLGVYAAQGALGDFVAAAGRIRALPGVTQAIPVVEGQVLLNTASGQSAGGAVRGISPEDLRARPLIADALRAGSLDAFQGEDAILIGAPLARRLGISVGDPLTVVSPQGRATVFGTVPRLRTYRIAALFEVGMQDYDNGIVFLPLAAAQLFFQLPNAVSEIEVHIANPDQAQATAAAIRRALPGQPLRIADWQDANSGYFQTVQVQRNVMFLILTLIILVAAFNIVSALIMLVKDKARDIAVLRTIGATQGAILRVFLLCGASVGIAGTLLGFAIGLVFCLNIERIRQFVQVVTGTPLFSADIYFLTQLPAVVDPLEVAQVVGLGLGLSLLATLYPSWRAARRDPVEALRNE